MRTSFERAGCLVFCVHGHAMQRPGWPDLEVVAAIKGEVKAHTLRIEVKVNDDPLSAVQLNMARELALRGQPIAMCRVRSDQPNHKVWLLGCLSPSPLVVPMDGIDTAYLVKKHAELLDDLGRCDFRTVRGAASAPWADTTL